MATLNFIFFIVRGDALKNYDAFLWIFDVFTAFTLELWPVFFFATSLMALIFFHKCMMTKRGFFLALFGFWGYVFCQHRCWTLFGQSFFSHLWRWPREERHLQLKHKTANTPTYALAVCVWMSQQQQQTKKTNVDVF